MEAIDIAWAAGLYEGEGWCEVRYSQTVQGAARSVRISVGSTDRDVLAKLEKIFGGTVIEKPYGGTRFPNAKLMYVWRLGKAEEVVAAINVMWPFLASRRRSQLQPVLDAATLMPPPGESGHTHCKNGHELTPENLIPRREKRRDYMRCKACYTANWKRRNARVKAARSASQGS